MANQIREIWRGDPSFIAYADEAITAGDLVKSTSSEDVVDDAGKSTYTESDIHVSMCDAAGDDEICIGIALEDASAAADYISVNTEGLYIMRSGGAIGTGKAVSPTEADPQEVVVVADTEEEFKVGKALTGASAENKYLIVLLRV